MTKYPSTLLVLAAVMTFSAKAQVTHTTEVTETETGQSATVRRATPVASSTSTTVSEVAPGVPVTPTGVVEVSPAEPSVSTTVTEIAPAAPVTSTTVTAGPAITVTQHLDPVVARRHLSVAPHAVIITPEQRTALERTVTIETRTEPVRRVYNVERNVVIVEEQGKSLELPFVTVPVLFVVDTAKLLDAESRMALDQTATVIKEIAQTEPNALFDIEGHTSTEGSDEHNLELSADRAKRVFAELTQRYGVPPTALTAHGYGENFPMYPGGTEAQLQADRRVLVVRTR